MDCYIIMVEPVIFNVLTAISSLAGSLFRNLVNRALISLINPSCMHKISYCTYTYSHTYLILILISYLFISCNVPCMYFSLLQS